MNTLTLLGRNVSNATVETFFQDHLGHLPDWEDLELCSGLIQQDTFLREY